MPGTQRRKSASINHVSQERDENHVIIPTDAKKAFDKRQRALPIFHPSVSTWALAREHTHTHTCTQSNTELPAASREGHIYFLTLDRALGRYRIVDGVMAGAQQTQLRSHLAKTHPQGNFLKRAEEEDGQVQYRTNISLLMSHKQQLTFYHTYVPY